MHRRVAMILVLALAVVSGLWAEQEPRAEPMGPALPVVLNIIPGIGVGSFVMRDPLGGIIGLGGEILGVGLVGYGVIYAIGQAVAVSLAEVLTLGFGDPTVETRTVEAFVFSGLAVWGCTRIFEIIRPFCFARQRDARIAARASASMVPRVGLLLGSERAHGATSLEPGLSLTLRY
jgi:hypothetical protein